MNTTQPREYAPDEIVNEVQLSLVDGVGSLSTKRLLDRFGTADSVLRASMSELEQVQGIGSKTARAIVEARDCLAASETIRRCGEAGIDLVCMRDSRYPERLRTIHDPPQLLYVKGRIEPSDAFAIAVVGTRGISYYGRRQTTMLTTGLVAAGFTIVSGLARGVDGTAHEAALTCGGRTLAVLGSGLLNIYPPEHVMLADRVVSQGALISEFPLDAPGSKGSFPRRNRIVSGLALGVLVTESPMRSGSLITARLAMEQDRDVFAVPGPIDSENSRGCHRLIRDGAVLVESVDDIVELLSPLMKPVVHRNRQVEVHVPREIQLNDRESAVLACIGAASMPIDALIEASKLAPHQVIAVLSILEMRGLVVRTGGNTVRRV